MTSPTNNSGTDAIAPRITFIPCGELKIYGVSEHELEAIDRGGPESIFFGVSIFALGTALSFTVTLLTTEIKAERVFNGLLIATLVGYVAGIVLGLLWLKASRSKKSIVKEIRQRLPPPGQALPISPISGQAKLLFKLSGTLDPATPRIDPGATGETPGSNQTQ